MDGRPKIQDVASATARWMETLEDVLAQVNRKGASAGSFGAVDGARASTLEAPATEAIEIPQVAKHTFHRDLAAQVGEIHRAVWFGNSARDFKDALVW